MERFGEGWTRALEQPMFLELLPDATGLRVLDLGCGAGQLSFHLAQAGAANVIAIDISRTMLDLARRERNHPRVSYRREAIEQVRFGPGSFDVIVSSLALHYVPDYRGLVHNIAEWLTPGGVLVYSTEHPIYTARLPGEGWVRDDHGQPAGWQIDNYFHEGPREERWFVEGVRKYHRTFRPCWTGCSSPAYASSASLSRRPAPSGSSAVHTSASTSGDRCFCSYGQRDPYSSGPRPDQFRLVQRPRLSARVAPMHGPTIRSLKSETLASTSEIADKQRREAQLLRLRPSHHCATRILLGPTPVHEASE